MTRRPMQILTAAILAVTVALAPALAEAAAGGGTSAGSRGTRTYTPAPSTPTAPSAAPVQRSVTPPPSQTQRPSSPSYAPAPAPQPSFAQRNPFLTGLMGGLIGAGIGGLLFGHGFGGGLDGFASVIGLLLQFALIAGIIMLAVAFFRRRQGGPAYAGMPHGAFDQRADVPRSIVDVTPLDVGGGHGGTSPGIGSLQLAQSDFAEFEQLLAKIQGAWSLSDIAGLRQVLTPEMVSYFAERLAADASKGVANHVEDVKLLQGDLSEAWTEGEVAYATVAMRWSARDYTVETASGRVVQGDRQRAGETVEVWTFMRAGAGRWLLSAIQQPS